MCSLYYVGLCDKVYHMRKEIKPERNKDLVEKRLLNPEKWSWGQLGKFFHIDRYTARDLFFQHLDKYNKKPIKNIDKTK